MLQSYYCGICDTRPTQISHHKAHIQTQKHLDKKKIFSLTLDSLSKEEYEEKYKNLSKESIINNTETMYIFNSKDEPKKIVKKLNDEENNIEYEVKSEIKTEEEIMSEIQEKMNNTYNRDMLRDKIHDIHNFLRNNGAGYGMNSLKIFNIFYGLKKIEIAEKNNKNTFKILEIDETCTFSYLLKLAEEGKDEILAEHINGTSEKDGMLDYMFKHENIKKLLYYDIPRHLKSSVFSHLIKEIEDLSRIEQHSNVLLSGKIYEYFVGRDEKAISELGAYFTNRLIVEFIFEKIDPTLHEDGSVPTMADIFGGSGGFTIEYIRYLQNKYPSINWETELKKVYHFDMNNDVIKSAGLEFFCLTGVIPDMNTNIKCVNSFKENFKNRRFHNLFTNPPYSGDGYEKSKKIINNNKVINYLKNEIKDLPKDNILHIQRNRQMKKLLLENAEDKKKHNENQKVSLVTCSTMQEKSRIKTFAEKYNITKANDKEACSLMLIMDMVAPGGTASGVLKEGVFFNKKYQNIRRVLIENFHVRYIISVPSDQFENTSTKTSIVIFDNLGEEKPTTQVVFSELVVEKFPKDTFEEIGGEIILIESKDDIKGVKENIIATATREEILANPICSLNGKDYNKQEIVCGEEYELIKINDLCNIKFGKRITKSKDGIDKNKADIAYPVYGGGNISFYTKESNRPKNTLIVSRFAVSKECVRLINEDFYLNDGGLSIHSINDNNQTYINYILLSVQNYIYNMTRGSIQKGLHIETFKNFKIPIPKTPEKLQYWVDRISTPYEAKNQKLKEIEELEKKVQDRIQEIIDTEECEEKELGEVCDIKSGNHSINKSDFKNGPYPIIGGGTKPIGTHNEYNCDENIILCASHGTVGFLSMYPIKTFITMCFAIIVNNKKLNKYIYKYLKINQNKINKLGNGSTLKCMTIKQLSKVKIPIPTNPEIIKAMEPDFQRIEQLQGEVKEAEELYQQYIQELAKEAIPPELNVKQEVVVEEIKEESKEDNNDTISDTTISETSSNTEEKDYSQYNTKELKTFCKEKGITGYSKCKKNELIHLLQNK